MIQLVPRKIIGTIVCATALLANFMPMARAATEFKLENIKDPSISDPQYKRYLQFMGSWFIGDQSTEEAVWKGVGGSKMTVAQHLYTLLPLLKTYEAKEKAFDPKLRNQAKVVEYALIIDQILSKLANPKIDTTFKKLTIENLNNVIFSKIDSGETVLIPVSWKNTKPGSILLSLSKEDEKTVMRIYDTLYTFDRNNIIADPEKEYPLKIVPWQEIRFDSDFVRKFNLLIPGLVILRDDNQLDQYNLPEKSLVTYFIQKLVLPRENFDIGRLYFYSVFLLNFGRIDDMKHDGTTNVLWPLTSLTIGPVGDILAYISQSAFDFKNYPLWKLEMGYLIVQNFLKRYASDSDIHQETRSRIVVAEILKRSANRLLRDAFEFARIQNWIPNQVGEADNSFWKYLNDKIKASLDFSKAKNQDKLKLIKEVVKLREKVLAWVKEKNIDTHKLSKLTRSLGQREMSVTQNPSVIIDSIIDLPIDLTNYNMAGTLKPDFSNCMADINMKVSSLNEFIKVFSSMEPTWHWFKFGYEVQHPHCKPFFRRNSELILKNLELGGLDKDSLAKWTPINQKQYKKFTKLAMLILNTVSSLPSCDRTLEDYLIIMRLQRVAWRVAQALDSRFAVVEPQRHLDLVQYSLSYPQCHKLLRNQMSYGNYFLADSGSFSNILSYESVTEMRDLCAILIDEENSGKPVLNHGKYASVHPIAIDFSMFDRINPGDREIYFKMAQNPQIAQIVRENLQAYNYGETSVVGNAARAVSLGNVGSQFIYYQFFDALKLVFTANVAFESQISAEVPVKITYLPISTYGSFLLVLPKKGNSVISFDSVNQELIKKAKKSYLKVSITEMLTSHILGLDVIVNHIGRGSIKFWSSGNIIKEQGEKSFWASYKFIETIEDFVNDVKDIAKIFMDRSKPNSKKDMLKIKAYRKNVAGSADFFLNCSAHLLRKLDVAPKYEELIMTLLMKTFTSTDKELLEDLKNLEMEVVSIGTDEDKEAELYKSGDRSTEAEKNKDYLKEGKTTPDERLKSLINWATVAVRFAARIRSLKPEWKNRYPEIPKHFYATMIKYSRFQKGNNRRLAHLNKNLVAHVDYLLFMICAMNPDDPNLRLEIYENLKPDASDELNFPQDSSVLPAAMVLHRMLALSEYEYDEGNPITDDFITNQFGVVRVMEAIKLLTMQNESFLALAAKFISPFLNLSPKSILDGYGQGDNLEKGVLLYGRFSINLVQGTFTENGNKARDPNTIMRYVLFREFFSSGNEQVTPTLGKETHGCPNRYEVENFLISKSKYSICEDTESKKISIYRRIPRFSKPCLLIRRQRIIHALQRSFSIYPNTGVDLYLCSRGNNAHFVWIKRDELEPSYVSHGRLSQYIELLVEGALNDSIRKASEEIANQLGGGTEEFQLDLKPKVSENDSHFGVTSFFLPAITFPKLEIREIGSNPVFPLTAESKLMVIPEPMIRFSGGSFFGTYNLGNKLIFMFQQFRFRDRPDVPLTFFENKKGDLEMKGRADLTVCDDQIFENNFWPALMMRKTGESGERRFAYVPIANSEGKVPEAPSLNAIISTKYDVEKSSSLDTSNALNDSIIFMEEYPVDQYVISEIKTAAGTIHKTFGYRLKPTSRLQRLLLAFNNLRLRNYEVSLKYLDPRSEIDHNTPFNSDEIKILEWMVTLKSGQEPEALALRIMAKIHLILDDELFPKEYEKISISSSKSTDDISAVPINNEADLINIYFGKAGKSKNYDVLDQVDQLDSGVSDGFEIKERLGRYFAFLPLLPKRFHVDQVFREAMASRIIQNFLGHQYNYGQDYPKRAPDTQDIELLNNQIMDVEEFTARKCDYNAYLFWNPSHSISTIGKKMLAPLTDSEEKQLQAWIDGRLALSYAAFNCERPRLIVQKLIQLHGNKKNIPSDLQELAMLHFYLTGNPYSVMEGYIYALAHPKHLHNGSASAAIDLKQFEFELTPKTDKGFTSYPYPVHLRNLYNLCPSQNPKSVNKSSALNGYVISTNYREILKPLLPSAPSAETAKEEVEINSIKFTQEDLAYIGNKDRELFKEVIKKINGARSKSSDTIEKLIDLTIDSKTQKGLQIAISDYMNTRTNPIDFNHLDKTLFNELRDYIKKRTENLSKNMKKLEAKYARFYSGTVNAKGKNEISAAHVLTSLKRIFNNDGIPSLKDLRDCFMQLSRSCLRSRLPELPESSIVKITQVLKSYYIQTIIFNNLKAIDGKIKTFQDLTEKAAAAEVKLGQAEKAASARPSEIQDIKDEIFDHKDTALLSVEDIYVDMEKLLQLEERLKDPVTLNFEFMSAKFYLTKTQVVDINSLARRNWEEKLKEEVIEECLTYFSGAEPNLDGKNEKFMNVFTKSKFIKLVKKHTTADLLTREMLNDVWTFMPRDERRVKSDDYKNAKDQLYKNRPVLEQLKSVGELQPYDPKEDAYFSRVIQRKMAAGKTTVLGTAATVKKADGKTLSVLVILSSLYQSSAPDMQKRTSEFFNTRGFAFSMPKPRLTIPKPDQQDHPARSFLLWTLKTLINTINSNSYLVVTPETLQSFLNSYIEFLDSFVNTPNGRLNPELSRCLQLFATIYDIFRSRGSIILDEIDSSMRPQKELNFPTTNRENILLSGVELTSDLLLHSALNKEINDAGLNLLANQQAALNNDQYEDVRTLWRNYVQSQLEDEKSIWFKTFFPKNQVQEVVTAEDLVKFFFDPSPLDKSTSDSTDMAKQILEAEIDKLVGIKKYNPKIFHAMMVVKMQFKSWLKNCFKGSVNEHYGPALNKPNQKPLYYAIPYMAANTPAEGSIFADRWETVNKTFMMYLVKNLTLEDLSMILLDLRTLSQSNAQGLDIKSEFTEACPGFDIINLKFNAQNRLVDKDEKVSACMKSRSPAALKLIFYWVTRMIFENEQFYAEQITSNAINLTTMFPSVQGYSGTIDNVNILPHQVMIEAEIDHRKNEQANGAIAMKLLQQKDCVTTVQKIEEFTEIDKLLDVMCRKFPDLSAFSAFVDAGALLKEFSNAEVAFALGRKFKREIILFYDERSNQLSFHDPKNGPKHVTALEGSETKYLNAATNSIVKNRFTYYDQRHITGSDILQPPTAKAFLTIGPKVLLRDILQGVMRMRQFQSGQSIHFITTSAVETLLSKFSQVAPVNSDGSPRVDQRHLIALGALNEDEKQLNENVRLYRVKIDAEIRAFVLDQITEALAKVDPFTERVRSASSREPLIFGFNHEQLFLKTRALFIRNVQENPVNWASVNTMTKASEAVKSYAMQRINMIPDIWKVEGKWDQVVENLERLVEEIDPNEDEDSKLLKARSVLNYLGEHLEISEISSKFGKSTSENVDLGSTVEMELQLELQQELELELEQQILDGGSEKPLPEPVLEIELEKKSSKKPPINLTTLASISFWKSFYTSSPAVGRVDPYEVLNGIPSLLTPWSLYKQFGGRGGGFSEALKKIYRADIFCPGLPADENDISNYCLNINGFVGLSAGLAKVTTSGVIDFVTMSSREGTHLLFWRGRASTDEGYKYAVFLISGSEAISLHRNWGYTSCSINQLDSFWLTDLYGFEVHGSPFASKALSSNHFSLLESEYEENFAQLHFRALLLNASYNVIMTSKSMYDSMRAWIGDVSMIKASGDNGSKIGVKREIIETRLKFFINRLTWMSKLRDEIVPDDPFMKDILKVYSNQQVNFEDTAASFKAQLNRGQTETYSDTMAQSVLDPEDEKAKPWKASRNINKTKSVALFNWTVLILVILVLVGIVLAWGHSVGIDWPGSKWISLITKFADKKADETVKKANESDENINN